MQSDRKPEGVMAGSATDMGSDATLTYAEVNDLVQQIVKSARAHQIYDVANPVYQRFVTNLRETFASLLARGSMLHFELTDDAMMWEGQRISPGEAKENLAFLFFRDGVRSLTFLAGFENEVTSFLEVVHRGRQLSRVSEDLLTLLWQADFQAFRYGYVDQLAQNLEVPEAKGIPTVIPHADDLEVRMPTGPREAAPVETAAEPAAVEAETVEGAPPMSMGSVAPVTPTDGIVRPCDF